MMRRRKSRALWYLALASGVVLIILPILLRTLAPSIVEVPLGIALVVVASVALRRTRRIRLPRRRIFV